MEELAPDSTRRRLGRGLNALLGTAVMADQEPAADSQDSSSIHVDLIERNPFQPRREFEQSAINELADSIRQHGILQPILVRQTGDNYQLIAGERRLIAAKKAGLELVPCRVLVLDDRQVSEVALEENLKRQDLGVLEKAQAFQDYLQRFQCSIEELARRLSLDRSTVSNMVRLLDLPDAVKQDVNTGKITGGHARALLSLSDDAAKIELCQRIQQEHLSVRKTEEAVRDLLQAGIPDTVPFPGTTAESGAPAKPGRNQLTNHLLSLQDQLRESLGAKVEIKLKGKEAGKIVIEFSSNEDFERILANIRHAA